jgi:SMC interacting uncharacterized protein involved in chromosome segregation
LLSELREAIKHKDEMNRQLHGDIVGLTHSVKAVEDKLNIKLAKIEALYSEIRQKNKAIDSINEELDITKKELGTL